MATIEQLKAALSDPEYYRAVVQGVSDAMNRGAIGGLLGAPVDAANGLLNAGKMAAGYVGHKTGLLSPDQMPQPDAEPLLGSEWFGKQMQNAGIVSPQRNAPAEFLAGVAGIPAMGMAAAKIGPAIEGAAQTAYNNAIAQTPYNTATGGQAGMVNFKAGSPKTRPILGGVFPELDGVTTVPNKAVVVSSDNPNLSMKTQQDGKFMAEYSPPWGHPSKPFYAIGDDPKELLESSLQRILNSTKGVETAEATKFNNSLLGMLQAEFGKNFSLGKSTQSRSKYITHDPSGTKIRISDHRLPLHYDQPDIDLDSSLSINEQLAAIRKYLSQ